VLRRQDAGAGAREFRAGHADQRRHRGVGDVRRTTGSTYLRFGHAISYQRLSRMLLELFGLTISEGALDPAFRRGKLQFDADVASILARLRRARVVSVVAPIPRLAA